MYFMVASLMLHLLLLLLLLFLESRRFVVGVAVIESPTSLIVVSALVVTDIRALTAIIAIPLIPIRVDYTIIVATARHIAFDALLRVLPPVVDAIQSQVAASLAAHAVVVIVAAHAVPPLLVARPSVTLVAVVIAVEACLPPARERLALVPILAAGHGWILVGAGAVQKFVVNILSLNKYR